MCVEPRRVPSSVIHTFAHGFALHVPSSPRDRPLVAWFTTPSCPTLNNFCISWVHRLRHRSRMNRGEAVHRYYGSADPDYSSMRQLFIDTRGTRRDIFETGRTRTVRSRGTTNGDTTGQSSVDERTPCFRRCAFMKTTKKNSPRDFLGKFSPMLRRQKCSSRLDATKGNYHRYTGVDIFNEILSPRETQRGCAPHELFLDINAGKNERTLGVQLRRSPACENNIPVP